VHGRLTFIGREVSVQSGRGSGRLGSEIGAVGGEGGFQANSCHVAKVSPLKTGGKWDQKGGAGDEGKKVLKVSTCGGAG